VLGSVVTDHIRVLRLLWTLEYHEKFLEPEETISISIKSFPRHTTKSVIKDLQADKEICEGVPQE